MPRAPTPTLLPRVALLLVVHAAPAGAAESTARASPGRMHTITDPELGPLRRGEAGNLDLELAYGRTYHTAQRTSGAARIRVGGLFVYEPWYPSLGVFLQLSTQAPPVVGVEGELMHLWRGTWAQLGAGLDFRARYGALLSVGWSAFGVQTEVWRAPTHDVTWAVLGKLRLPLGVLRLMWS
ncbi:MAG: hypothetical protein HY903_07190 [Deltaproteobacteria bacterium]|nr:hypothetical protein [Deltaproteobacteria bacterium]